MSNNNGGPAFPFPDTYHPSGQVEYGTTGMTLRDYFAAKAMQHILTQTYDYEETPETHQARSRNAAKDAYTIADAMLTAREVGNE